MADFRVLFNKKGGVLKAAAAFFSIVYAWTMVYS
jgi:hypothetical protein